MFQDSGFYVTAAAFERDSHGGRLPSCDVHPLGRIDNGNYLARVTKLIMALPKLRRLLHASELAYASGPDMALITLIAGIGVRRPLIYEVGDIREIEVSKGAVGYVIRRLIRLIANHSSLLIATTPAFIEEYYRRWIKTYTPAIILENKLEAGSIPVRQSYKTELLNGRALIDRPLRIGYFGLIRDTWSLDVLKLLANSGPERFVVIIAGLPISTIDLTGLVRGYQNIEYRGIYRSPQDLPALYGDVDMVWACYPPIRPNDWNLKWARPNRFYESCFFKKPMFTRSGSQDSLDVSRYKIGCIISDSVPDDVVKQINRINYDDLAAWEYNMSQLNENIYLNTDEPERLSNAVKSLCIN
jgi:succinoglycan biosynthesis protein ExoL